MLKDIRHIKGFFFCYCTFLQIARLSYTTTTTMKLSPIQKQANVRRQYIMGMKAMPVIIRHILPKHSKSVHCAIIIAYRLILSLMPLLFTLMYSLILNTAYVSKFLRSGTPYNPKQRTAHSLIFYIDASSQTPVCSYQTIIVKKSNNEFKKHITIGCFRISNLKHICTKQYFRYGKRRNHKRNLAGASIYIADLKTGATTDTNGSYKINNLKRGTYLLEINYTGYQPIIEKISIDKDTVMDFLLSPAVTELNELIITGVTRSTELRLSPVIVKAVDGKTLNQNSATNLIDALGMYPV
jgi:hypothetical protein